ncbi:hypothetical protein G4228_001444 [Cervus hanglu yarkandensis]|nr:hypothetical protein G4228_001444 [Cervus hanglu yarkandensis]
MRRYLRVVVLCLACGFCSLLYAFSQLAVSLEEGAGGVGGKPQAAAASWLGGDGRGAGRGVGSAGPAAHHGRSDRYGVEMQPTERVHLAVVACGERLEETVTMLKSALIFSIKPLQFHIFAEDQLHDSFKGILILKEVDSLLYVDTDILFLRPVDDIWSLLKKFNSTQIAAMAPEHEEPRIGWYNRFARHPYYGKTGVNSGVMLMNMTRMRRKYFKCSFEDDNIHSLLKPLELELQKTVHTYCGKIYKIFIKQLTKSIQDRYDRPPKER